MNIYENYNTATQKYGKSIVKDFTRFGLPDKYLLAACRFAKDTNKSLKEITSLFKDWNKYVRRFSNVDVNRLSYNEFINLIDKGKIDHGIPNIVYNSQDICMGEIKRAKDTYMIPVDAWCIDSTKNIDAYLQQGYKFYVIRILSLSMPYTYVVASIHNGEVDYWDSFNYPHREWTDGSYEEYLKKLPDEIIDYLYKIAESQITNENKQDTNMKTENRKRNVVRLTESQLKQMITESVKNLLNEGSYAEGLSSSQDFNEIKTKILWQVKRAKECLNSIEGIMNPDNEWESYHLALAISGLKEDVEYMQELGEKAGKIMHRIRFNSR